jgi:hypothetical protein
MPKRALQLQQLFGGDIEVRLIEPDASWPTPYVALSHCWGTNQTFTTTRGTFLDRTRGIEWMTIPQTFQDAITFALRLGFQYIWIDSLCIIQDDPEDWYLESVKMADIFQYAAVTLAATASHGDTHGCYEKHLRQVRDVTLTLPDCLRGHRVAVRPLMPHWDTATYGSFDRHFPLLTRAWVLQERLLARRMIHFCGSELAWECRELSACECGGLSNHSGPSEDFDRITRLGASSNLQQFRAYLYHGQYLQSYPFLQGSIGRYVETAEDQHFVDHVSYYHRVVEQYSALKLTKHTDRLPALRGLCSRLRPSRGTYASGLWMDSILYDLMWRVPWPSLDHSAFELDQSHSVQCKLPSWSWASIRDPVKYWAEILELPGQARPRPLAAESSCAKVSDQDIGSVPGHAVYQKVTITAVTRKATLVYRYGPTKSDEATEVDVFSYNLSIRGVRNQRYARDDIEIPFYADYLLCKEGSRHVPNSTRLLLLSVHPQVALVLLDSNNPESSRQPSNSNLPTSSALTRSFRRAAAHEIYRTETMFGIPDRIANQEDKSARENPKYVRIGIVRFPEELRQRYDINWMQGQTQKISIF